MEVADGAVLVRADMAWVTGVLCGGCDFCLPGVGSVSLAVESAYGGCVGSDLVYCGGWLWVQKFDDVLEVWVLS